MLETIIENILQLKNVIIVSGAGILVIACVLLAVMSKFRWNSYSKKMFGFFYDLRLIEIFLLAVSILKVLFAVAVLLSACRVETVHMVYFIFLTLTGCLLKRNLFAILTDLLNTVIMTGTLIVMGLLHGYLADVYFDPKVALALAVLWMFLLMSSVCDVFRSTNCIMDGQVHRSKYQQK